MFSNSKTTLPAEVQMSSGFFLWGVRQKSIIKLLGIVFLILCVGCTKSTAWKSKEIIINGKVANVAYLKSTHSNAYLILVDNRTTRLIPNMRPSYPAMIIPLNTPLYKYRFDPAVLKTVEDKVKSMPDSTSSYDKKDIVHKECAKPLFALKPQVKWTRAFQLACFEVVDANWKNSLYLAGHHDKIDSQGKALTSWNGDGEWKMIGPVRSMNDDEAKAFSFMFDGPKLLIPLPNSDHESLYTDKFSLTLLEDSGSEKVFEFSDVQGFSPRFEFPYLTKEMMGKWIEQKDDVSEEGSPTFRITSASNPDFSLELRKYRKHPMEGRGDVNYYQLVLYGEERGGRIAYFDPAYPLDTWKKEVQLAKNVDGLTQDERSELLKSLGDEYKNQQVGGSLLKFSVITQRGKKQTTNWGFFWPPNDEFDPYEKKYGEPFSRLHIRVVLANLEKDKQNDKLNIKPSYDGLKGNYTISDDVLKELKEITIYIATDDQQIKTMTFQIPRGTYELLKSL